MNTHRRREKQNVLIERHCQLLLPINSETSFQLERANGFLNCYDNDDFYVYLIFKDFKQSHSCPMTWFPWLLTNRSTRVE